VPGLSPDNNRFERIASIINDGLEDNVSVLDSSLIQNNRSCWRCERPRAENHLTLCEECRAYLSCEVDKDPKALIPPKPTPSTGFYGWSYAMAAAAAARQNGAVTLGTAAQTT
jgi:hypothetical protein